VVVGAGCSRSSRIVQFIGIVHGGKRVPEVAARYVETGKSCLDANRQYGEIGKSLLMRS
jgi:hypothetical protein